MARRAVLAVLLLVTQGAVCAQYTDPSVCATCHLTEAAKWRGTAMARSFAVATPGPSGTYYHAPSDIFYEVFTRGSEYFQKQYQKDAAGTVIHAMENRIDYVLGSGSHSRTFLHRTPANTLIELPLAWYAEKGGSWAMNPGYDRPDHEGLRRKIGYDCMFCHNGYPAVTAAAAPAYPAQMPNGIDCQRCHGPGAQHVRTAGRNGTIVNPARLSLERQSEVCMQCHLETTSFPLPNSLLRYGRDPFSYRPGQPLTDFRVYFDRAANKEDSVEINSSAYRLRQSVCFLRSASQMTCTTCHDPHQARHDTAHYDAACRQCHTADLEAHAVKENCAGCHMPKVRTTDVIHAVMTDHRIQRPAPAGNLLVESAERKDTSWRGEVAPYLTGQDELHTAAAQIAEDSNRKAGIPRMIAAVEKIKPTFGQPYLDLAEALRRDGQCADAARYYDQARRHGINPLSVTQKAALCMDPARASGLLNTAVTASPDSAETWTQLGLTLAAAGRKSEALTALEKALALDPDQPEAWNSLGGVLLTSNPARAEQALHSALRLHPNYPEAWNNLGSLLSNAGKAVEARRSFESALRYRPNYAFARYNYAIALLRTGNLRDARAQLETALRSEENNADAHELLGVVFTGLNETALALNQFRATVRLRPDALRAHLRLGEALAAQGDVAAAAQHLRAAAASIDPAVSRPARELMQQLGIP